MTSIRVDGKFAWFAHAGYSPKQRISFGSRHPLSRRSVMNGYLGKLDETANSVVVAKPHRTTALYALHSAK